MHLFLGVKEDDPRWDECWSKLYNVSSDKKTFEGLGAREKLMVLIHNVMKR